MLKKRFQTRERDSSHARLQTLMNGMDEEEWFDGDEEHEIIVPVQQTTLQREERHGAKCSGSGSKEYSFPNDTEWSYSGGDRLTDRFIGAPHQDASEWPVFPGLPDINGSRLSMSLSVADALPEQQIIVQVPQTILQQEEQHGASTGSVGMDHSTPNVTEWHFVSGCDRPSDPINIAPHQDASEVPVFSGWPNLKDYNCKFRQAENKRRTASYGVYEGTVPVGRNHGPRVRNIKDVRISKGAPLVFRGILVLQEVAQDSKCSEETRRTATQLLQNLVQVGKTEVGTEDQKRVLPSLYDATDPLIIEAFILVCFDICDGARSRKDHEKVLEAILQGLVKESLHNWTYGIFWKLSRSPSGDSILCWGDGYYKGPRDKGFIKPEKTQMAKHQLHRKKVLREQKALVSRSDEDATEDVSDTEWFYLVSMAHSFARGVGTPGPALESGKHVWLEKADKASNQVCTRAHLAKISERREEVSQIVTLSRRYLH